MITGHWISGMVNTGGYIERAPGEVDLGNVGLNRSITRPRAVQSARGKSAIRVHPRGL